VFADPATYLGIKDSNSGPIALILFDEGVVFRSFLVSIMGRS
jgi:hypothetical protein